MSIVCLFGAQFFFLSFSFVIAKFANCRWMSISARVCVYVCICMECRNQYRLLTDRHITGSLEIHSFSYSFCCRLLSYSTITNIKIVIFDNLICKFSHLIRFNKLISNIHNFSLLFFYRVSKNFNFENTYCP